MASEETNFWRDAHAIYLCERSVPENWLVLFEFGKLRSQPPFITILIIGGSEIILPASKTLIGVYFSSTKHLRQFSRTNS
jgi:hypothetical protein